MKQLLLLIITITMSFTAFSQALTPTIFVSGKDTLFCFTIPQCKHIAKHLEHGRQCNGILAGMETEINILNKIGSTQNITIKTLVSESDNKQHIIASQEKIIQEQEAEIQQNKKELKKQRWQKRILGAGIITTGIIALVL